MDEIGFHMNMTAGYIITRKNSRHAHAATGNSRDHLSAAVTISADGKYLPPFFLLAGKRTKAEYLRDDKKNQGNTARFSIRPHGEGVHDGRSI